MTKSGVGLEGLRLNHGLTAPMDDKATLFKQELLPPMVSDVAKMSAQSKIEARQTLADLDPSDMLMEEQESLADLEADYREGNLSRARKKAFSQALKLSRSGRSKPWRSSGLEFPLP